MLRAFCFVLELELYLVEKNTRLYDRTELLSSVVLLNTNKRFLLLLFEGSSACISFSRRASAVCTFSGLFVYTYGRF